MPVTVNGRKLGVARNGVFTSSNTDPIPGGRLWPEAAASWVAMRAAAIADGIEPWEFMPAGSRSSARDLDAQWFFWRNQPPAAAVPGTSNHGWAIAVDVLTRRAAAWVIKHGRRFGWSWDEGRRVGEWWHFRYVGGYKPAKDPLRPLTATERRWVRELDKLRGERRDVPRRRVLVRELTRQRKRIWKAATGEAGGWTKARRRERYRILLSRTR